MAEKTQATSEKPDVKRTEQVLHLVREAGLVRALAARGISPTHLQRLYERGLLERSGRAFILPPMR
jgi:hypothetical protein